MARVLVTGVAGSIGKPLAAHFLSSGDQVTGLDLREPEFPADVETTGFRFAACDLGDAAAVEAVLAEQLADGPFEVVINNVGLIYSALTLQLVGGRLQTHDFDDWKRVLDVTLSAAFYVTAVCGKAMAQNGVKGVVVNVSSICAHGNRGQAAYSAAKAGINGMTVALAKEFGPLGIRVAAIAPGFIDAPSTRAAVSEGHLERTIKSIPLGRLGEISEVVHAIRFIIDNGYFHGKVLDIDGGLTL